MADLGRHLRPGLMLEKHLDGMLQHGYYDRNHRMGMEPGEYREAARKLLTQAPIGYMLKQPSGPAILLADKKLNQMGYVNTVLPTKSTMFKPRQGVERALREKMSRVAQSDRLKLDLKSLRAPAKAAEAPKLAVPSESPKTKLDQSAVKGNATASKAPPPTPKRFPQLASEPPTRSSERATPKPPAPKPPAPKPPAPKPPAPKPPAPKPPAPKPAAPKPAAPGPPRR